MPEESQDQAARARLAEARVRLIMALISLAVMAWMLIPEWRRHQLRMRLMLTLRNTLGACARRAAHGSMALELRAGCRDYSLPYVLSVARDRAAGWYERSRDAA